jgi:YesN/AraC family two-component response regulator
MVMLSDINMPGMEGITLLDEGQEAVPRPAGDDGDSV